MSQMRACDSKCGAPCLPMWQLGVRVTSPPQICKHRLTFCVADLVIKQLGQRGVQRKTAARSAAVHFVYRALLFSFAAATAANTGAAAGAAAHGGARVSAALNSGAATGLHIGTATAGRASGARVALASHARIALNARACRGAVAAARLNAGPAARRRAGFNSDTIAATVILPIAMAMMPALVRSVTPAVPAIDAAPADTLAPCEAAAVPARAMPAIEIEAITATFVHIDAHGDLIDETGFRAGQLVDGKTSCFAWVATSSAPAATAKVSVLMGVSSCCPPTQCNVVISCWFRCAVQ